MNGPDTHLLRDNRYDCIVVRAYQHVAYPYLYWIWQLNCAIVIVKPAHNPSHYVPCNSFALGGSPFVRCSSYYRVVGRQVPGRLQHSHVCIDVKIEQDCVSSSRALTEALKMLWPEVGVQPVIWCRYDAEEVCLQIGTAFVHRYVFDVVAKASSIRVALSHEFTSVSAEQPLPRVSVHDNMRATPVA